MFELYDDISSVEPKSDISKKLILGAIILSLLVHLSLFFVFRKTSLTWDRDAASFGRDKSRVLPVTLNPESFDEIPEAEEPVLKKPIEQTPIEISEPPVSLSEPPSEMQVKPNTKPVQSSLDTLIDNDKSSLGTEAMTSAVQRAGEKNAAEQDAALASSVSEILTENIRTTPNQPILNVPSSDGLKEGDAAASKAGNGFTDLDRMIAQGGTAEGAPIILDSGLLFGFDAYELRPAAVEGLYKVGQLIARSKNPSIVIEGHTDNFGSDEYNYDLSVRRAESVRNWFIQNLGIPANRIRTVGYGKTRLLVKEGTEEEQQINRRVEISIRGEHSNP